MSAEVGQNTRQLSIGEEVDWIAKTIEEMGRKGEEEAKIIIIIIKFRPYLIRWIHSWICPLCIAVTTMPSQAAMAALFKTVNLICLSSMML